MDKEPGEYSKAEIKKLKDMQEHLSRAFADMAAWQNSHGTQNKISNEMLIAVAAINGSIGSISSGYAEVTKLLKEIEKEQAANAEEQEAKIASTSKPTNPAF